MYLTADEYLELGYAILLIPEGRGFRTQVPDLPECFSQGTTIQEAYDNTIKVMRNWMKATIEKAEFSVPEPRIWKNVGS